MVLGTWSVQNGACRHDGSRSTLARNTWAQKCFRVQTVEYLHKGSEIPRPKSEHDTHSCSHTPCIYPLKSIRHGDVLCNFVPRCFPGIVFLVCDIRFRIGDHPFATHRPLAGCRKPGDTGQQTLSLSLEVWARLQASISVRTLRQWGPDTGHQFGLSCLPSASFSI